MSGHFPERRFTASGGTALRAPTLNAAYKPELICGAANFRMGDLTGQFVPDPMWWRGEPLKTTQDHSAQ